MAATLASTIVGSRNRARLCCHASLLVLIVGTALHAQLDGPSNGQSVVPLEELPSYQLRTEVQDPLAVDDLMLGGISDFGDGTRHWVSMDVLVWWRKGIKLPVLATDNAAVPRVLYGDRMVGAGGQAGGRVNFGFWLNPEQSLGIGGTFLQLGEKSSTYDSTGEPLVVRPFTDGGAAMVLAVNVPPGAVGRFVGATTSDFTTAEVFMRRPFWTDGQSRLDLMSGYMLARIDESVTLRHQFTDGITNFDGTDFFLTKNKFHGMMLGVVCQHRTGPWTVGGTFKLGLGNMRQTVVIAGSDLSGVGPMGSLLARNSNAGIRKRDQFSAVREIGMNIVYQANSNVDVAFGYTAIFFKNTSQPGEHISTALPNPPQILSIDENYVAHGLNLTFTFKR